MDPNGTGGGGSSPSAAQATVAAWNYAANAQNYANPAVTAVTAAAAHQNYGNAQTAQNYASAINWWQQQAQAHAQQLAQQQAQAAQSQSGDSDSPPHQQQSSSQGSTPTSQSGVSSQQQQQQQQQINNMNMYQYNQQLLQYQYQQLQSANYQHQAGGVPNFGVTAAAAMNPAVYSEKVASPRRPAGSPVGKGSKRKRKDPNRPKRPTSAYFFFVSRQRKLCEERGEKITRVAEWTKEISAVWRALTPEEKVQYDEKAAVDKARYTSEMGKYKNKDPNRPKRPMSAYFLWLGDFRCKMKDKIPENKELLRAAGESWRALTESEKQPYEKQAEEERLKYETSMREYSQQGSHSKRAKEEDVDSDDSNSVGGLPVPQQLAQQQAQQHAQQHAQQQAQQQSLQQQQQQLQQQMQQQHLQQLQHQQMLWHQQMMGMQQKMSANGGQLHNGGDDDDDLDDDDEDDDDFEDN